jgi:4-amino-4-deoxy-L-arabinose transferase-like glycosyltransferase
VVFVFLFLWCGGLFFYGLNTGELYRTESLRAILAQEFLRSGNWIVPTLYGEPIFTKPPGMYSAIALFSWPFETVSECTARLPSAVAASVAVFLFYGCFARELGRRAGLVAAAILPASFMWLDKASAAEIDMAQVTWVMAALFCFLRALELEERALGIEDGRARIEDREAKIEAWRVEAPADGRMRMTVASPLSRSTVAPPPSSLARSPFPAPPAPSSVSSGYSLWFWWLGALLCVAGGILTKWTSPAFFYGTVVTLLWWRGRLRLLLGRHHLVSAAVCAGLCLAWIAAAVAFTSWHAVYGTVSREAFMRLLPSHHHRPYPWLESLAHPFKLLLANLPWSAFALLTLRPGFAGLWDERGRRLLQLMHCWTWPNVFFWSIIPEHAPRHSFPLFPGIAGLAALVWVAWLTGKMPWPLTASKVVDAERQSRSLTGVLAKLQRRATGMALQFGAKPGWVLLGMLTLWLVAKVAFVEVVVPARSHNREPRAKGERLAALVPPDKTLYLSKLKDEGIMFYYRRTVRRLESFEQLTSSTEPAYCILDDSEWREWDLPGSAVVIERMRDEQGDPIVLVKVNVAESSVTIAHGQSGT